jgi:hypothetical protein
MNLRKLLLIGFAGASAACSEHSPTAAVEAGTIISPRYDGGMYGSGNRSSEPRVGRTDSNTFVTDSSEAVTNDGGGMYGSGN